MVNALAQRGKLPCLRRGVRLKTSVVFQHPMASQGSVSRSYYSPEATESLSALEPISGMQLYLFCGLPRRIPPCLGKGCTRKGSRPSRSSRAISRASFLCGWVVPELLPAGFQFTGFLGDDSPWRHLMDELGNAAVELCQRSSSIQMDAPRYPGLARHGAEQPSACWVPVPRA